MPSQNINNRTSGPGGSKNERNNGNASQFDKLTKSMAQSVTLRAALKKFGFGLVGMAVTCFGLVNKAGARNKHCGPSGSRCDFDRDCCSRVCHFDSLYGFICQ